MPDLDEQEIRITKELIKNPRSSDNAISRATGIPVMTVNRKRKKLEEGGIISYYTSVKSFESGINIFHARQLYVIQLKSGVTRDEYLRYIDQNPDTKGEESYYVEESYIGEQNGRLALILLLEAKTEAELVDIFNGRIVKNIKKAFGENAITHIETSRINMRTRIFHNYMPSLNMQSGKIRKDWPDDYIFVTEGKGKEETRERKNWKNEK